MTLNRGGKGAQTALPTPISPHMHWPNAALCHRVRAPESEATYAQRPASTLPITLSLSRAHKSHAK